MSLVNSRNTNIFFPCYINIPKQSTLVEFDLQKSWKLSADPFTFPVSDFFFFAFGPFCRLTLPHLELPFFPSRFLVFCTINFYISDIEKHTKLDTLYPHKPQPPSKLKPWSLAVKLFVRENQGAFTLFNDPSSAASAQKIDNKRQLHYHCRKRIRGRLVPAIGSYSKYKYMATNHIMKGMVVQSSFLHFFLLFLLLFFLFNIFFGWQNNFLSRFDVLEAGFNVLSLSLNFVGESFHGHLCKKRSFEMV